MKDRHDLFREIEELIDRMSREFDEPGGGFEASIGGGADVDVAEATDEVRVTIDVPGFEKSEIDVTVRDSELFVTAEHAESSAESGVGDGERDVTYHRRERRRSVSRRIRLPTDVDETEASATYTNGVLTVTLPKLSADTSGGHNIDVS